MTGNPAYVNNIAGEQLLVQIEDTPGSGTYLNNLAVLINAERALEATAETKTSVVPRTDDPTQPGKTIRRTSSTDTKVSGSGTLDTAQAKTFFDWLMGGQPRQCVFSVSATGSLVVTGMYLLTSFKITGQVHEDSTCDITLEQANTPVSTAHV